MKHWYLKLKSNGKFVTIAEILVEDFVPDMIMKYITLNFNSCSQPSTSGFLHNIPKRYYVFFPTWKFIGEEGRQPDCAKTPKKGANSVGRFADSRETITDRSCDRKLLSIYIMMCILSLEQDFIWTFPPTLYSW